MKGTYLQSVVECATRIYSAKTPNPMLLASVANKAGKHLGIQPCNALSRGLTVTVILAFSATVLNNWVLLELTREERE